MSLSSEQLSILNQHASAGDRIAYYEALASFGDPYGVLALSVVLNDTLAGAAANKFFLNTATDEGIAVSHDDLAEISLRLMLADNQIRQFNGGIATVDGIQQYHRDVFAFVAGVSANAWTPNYYLESFETLTERQAAWNSMLESTSAGTYFAIVARQWDYIDEYWDSQNSTSPHDSESRDEALSVELSLLLLLGYDQATAEYLIGYSEYTNNLSDAGFTEALSSSSNQYGPYDISIPGTGQMVGGSAGSDVVSGDISNDVVIGFDGDDTIEGSLGSDRVYGGSGTDQVDYSTIDTGVVIQLGEDQVNADLWIPVATQGHSIEQVVLGDGSVDTLIDVESIVGTNDDDVVRINGSLTDISSAFRGPVGSIDGRGQGSGGDTIDLRGVIAADGVEVHLNTSGSISISENGDQSLNGLLVVDGFENVIGTASDDVIDFGEAVSGASGSNILIGGSGNDTIVGGAGDDVILGGEGNDSIDAGDGNDIIMPGVGDDNIDGGAGTDILSFYYSDMDEIAESGVTIDLREGSTEEPSIRNIEVVIGTDETDVFYGSEQGGEFFAGGNGDDTFYVNLVPTGDAPTVIWGGAGADAIFLSVTEFGYDYPEPVFSPGIVIPETHDFLEVNIPASYIYSSPASFTVEDREVGVLNVSIEGLEIDDFNAFDLDSLNLDPAIMAQIDIVLINPDVNDTVSFERETIPDNPEVVEDNGEYQIIGTTVFDLLGTDESWEIPLTDMRVELYDWPEVATFEIQTSGGQLSVFGPGAAVNFSYEYISYDGSSFWYPAYPSYPTPGFTGSGDEPVDAVRSYVPLLNYMVVDSSDVSHHTYPGFPGYDEIRGETTPEALGPYLTIESFADWFVVGGEVNDTSFSTSGSMVIELEPNQSMENYINAVEALSPPPPPPPPADGSTDTLLGSSGDDIIDASYLDTNANSVTDTGQTISAGAGNDTIYDGAGDDVLFGGAGQDRFFAGAGGDAYDGGDHQYDEVRYSTSQVGLTIDMTNAASGTGIAAGDTFENIERISGSNFDDVIILSGGTAVYDARSGDDLIIDGAGLNAMRGGAGADTFQFGAGDGYQDRIHDFVIGEDIIDISAWGVTQFSDLAITAHSSGNGTIISYGNDSIRVDQLTVSEATNLDSSSLILAEGSGAVGDGVVSGTDGDDLLNSAFLDVDGDYITDTGQTISGGAGRDNIYDGAGDDVVFGGAGQDRFYAGAGADAYDGGDHHYDEVLYSTSQTGLTIDMTNAANSTGIASGDTFANIERIRGSNYDDIIILSGSTAAYDARAGDDLIVDGEGLNTMRGGAGADTFQFNAGDGFTDRIDDFAIGEDFIDISAWGVTQFSDLTVTQHSSGNGIVLTYLDDSIRLSSVALADAATMTDSDFIFV